MSINSGLNQVKYVIAVASCKGGVGKSTVAVNLAFSLAALGQRVGLFDADIYGPSLPTMIASPETPLETQGNVLFPPTYAGVKFLSFGHIQEQSGPAILRGPIVTQVISQLISGTQWGDLDYLILDLPPGTGDIQITLAQLIPLTAAVIVTTPQYISYIDVEKGIQMFDRLQIPTVSVVENMSYFVCDSCDKQHSIFGQGALKRLVAEFGFKNTTQLPILSDVTEAGDSGIPYVCRFPDAELTSRFKTLAQSLIQEIPGIALQAQLPFVDMDDRGVTLQEPDGTLAIIDPKALRQACRCATCEDEMTGKKLLLFVNDDIFPENISPVGNYAVGINWSDRHSSLYPYEALRKLGVPAEAPSV